MGRSYIVIDRVDLTLNAGQRTALGLGPIGSDPRDAALRYALVEVTSTAETCVDLFFFAWERAAMTRTQLRAAVVADAQARLAAARNGRTEAQTFQVGARIEVE